MVDLPQTGLPVPAQRPKPWERDWNAARPAEAPQAQDAPVTARPWERDWSGVEAQEPNRGVMGVAKNIGAGMGERAADLVGGGGAALGEAGADARSSLVRRGFELFGAEPPEGYLEAERVVGEMFRQGREKAQSVDFGYEEMTSWDDFKEAPLRSFVPFALEQGLISLPDMAAAVANLPGYALLRSGELASERSTNKNMDEVTVRELVEAMPAAAASAFLERLGAKGVLGLDDAVGNIVTKSLKAGAKEGLTEAAQEGIEYAGTTVGTERPIDLAEAGERMAAGAVAGTGFGTAARGVTATGEAVARRRGSTEAEMEADAVPARADDENQDEAVAVEAPVAPQPSEAVERDAVAPAEPGSAGQAVSPPAAPVAPALTPEERATLRAAGTVDDDIDIMSRPEIEAELMAARQAQIPVTDDMIAAAMDYERQNAPQEAAQRASQTSEAEPAALVEQPRAQAVQKIEQAAAETETQPTEAQKEAGNYRKGKVRLSGLEISVENPKGSIRSGTDPNGQQWSVQMPAHYGYVRRTNGADGDQVDVYVGDNPESDRAYIVNQVDPDTGAFDEHKVLMGFSQQGTAQATYERGFSDGQGRERVGSIVPVDMDTLKSWLKEGDTTSPFAMEPTEVVDRSRTRRNYQYTSLEGFPALKSGEIRKPPSLIDFLAAKGGIRDERGELAAMDAQRVFVPGSGPLVRPRGLPLDQARELAEADGYLQDGMEIRAAIAQDLRSRDLYSENDQTWAAAYAEQERARQSGEDAEADAAEDIYNEIMALGYSGDRGDAFSRNIAERVILQGEDVDLGRAIEHVAQIMDFTGGLRPTGEVVENIQDTMDLPERAPMETANADAAQPRAPSEDRAPVRTRGEPREEPGREGEAEGSRKKTPVRRKSGEKADGGKRDQKRARQGEQERQPEEVRANVGDDDFGPDRDIPAFLRKEKQYQPADSRLSDRDQTRIRQIIQRVSGLAETDFQERIIVPGGIPRWGGDIQEAAGVYDPVNDAITLSLTQADRGTAYHEAFHRLQKLFMTDQEQRVLAGETERLRQIVRLGSPLGSMADTMAPIELEAEAFAVWSRQMDADNASGLRLHIAVRRAWQRLRSAVERVRNYLRGQGFNSLESIYGDAYAGRMTQRGRREDARREPMFQPARVSPDTPPRKAPASLITQRIQKTLDAGTARFKEMEGGLDRRTAPDQETFGDFLHRKFVDYLHPLYLMQKDVGSELNDLNDAYLNARLAEDTALSGIQIMHDKYVVPMVETLAKGDASIEDLHRYMYALHAEERNRVVGERNPEDSDLYKAVTDPSIKGASGMSTNEARSILAQAREDRAKFMALREAASHVRAMLDQSLRDDLAAGLISKETYDLLTGQWKHYVPLKGNDGQDAQGNWRPPSKGGFDVRGDEFKTALGRFDEADNILANAINQSEMSILRQKKNDVGKALLRFVNQFDPKGESIAQVYWSHDGEIGDISKAETLNKRVIGADGKVTTRKVSNPFTSADDVLATKVGGKTYYMRFRDEKVGHAVRKLGMAHIGGVTKLVRYVTVWQSIINTRYNPAFTPINIIRDAQTGAVHLLDEGFKTSEIAQVMRDIPKAWGALWRMERGKPNETHWDKWAAEYRANGGKITFHGYSTLEEDLRKLNRDIKAAAGNGSVPRTAFRRFMKFIEDLNDAGENGIRLAAYVAVRQKQGKTPKEAAFIARDLTVDFKKHGEWGPTMNSWYVFFNAALQGNYNIVRRMARSKKVQAAVGGFMFAGMMQHVWNSLMAGDDDDGENAYHSMMANEPWKVERQMVFFLPGRTDYVSFPLPYGFNAFYHLGVQGGAMTHGVRDPIPAMLDSARVAFDAFNPIGSGSLLTMVSPTIADLPVELGTNTNFFGSQIYPEVLPFDQSPSPNATRSWSSTSPVAKAIAEQINDWTGGNAVEPGAIDMYPDALEHVWGFFTGGVGRFASQVGETTARAVKGEFEPKKTPWIRSFYGQVDEDSQRTEYFKLRERVLGAAGYMKDYQGSGLDEDFERFLKENEVELAASESFKAAEKQRRKINKARRAIEADDSLSRAERERQLEELKQAELEIMRGARIAYQEAKRAN